MIGQRRNRLALVPVNPNPQPPNASFSQRQYGAQNRNPNQGQAGPPSGHGHGQGRGGRPGNGQGNNGRGNQGNGRGNDGRHGNGKGNGGKPTTPPPSTVPPPPTGATTGNAGDPFAIPTYTPGPGQPDPRDQTYYTNVARLLSQAEQGYAQANLQETYNATDYGEAQRNLALNQQQDTRNLAADALRSGLSNSGYLNTQNAQLTGKYITEGGDLAKQNQRSSAALEAAKAALLQGYSNDVAAEWAAAADRFQQLQLEQAQNAPPAGNRHDLKAIRKLLNKKHGGHKGRHGGRH